jgi:beta-propeller uncharacterized protein DUF5122
MVLPPGAPLAAPLLPKLPAGSRVDFATSGPGSDTVLFYSEPLPEPSPAPFAFICGTDEGRPLRHRLALFDGHGRLVWKTDVPQAAVEAAWLQPDGGVLVRGRLRAGVGAGTPSLEDDVLLWRVSRQGLEPGFPTLRRRDLGGERGSIPSYVSPDIRAATILADGRVVIAGDFDSVRGRRRIHIASLRPDGALEE